ASDWTGYGSSFNTTRQFQIRNTSDVTGIAPPPPPPSGTFTATYDFSGVTNTTGVTDPSPVPVVTGISFGSFSAIGVGTSGGAAANSSGSGRFSFNDWPLGATTATDVFTGSIDPTKYYEVTITPVAGTQVDISSVTFKFQRSGTGVRQSAVRASVDSYGANLTASINPANAALSVVPTNAFQVTDATTTGVDGCTVTLGAGFTNLTTAVKFRFYGINAEASGGTFSIDDVKFAGSTH
ncbi:MAG: hypothetical protein ABJB11_12055, partial [Ferruginibacter sp.]